jgi:hypothetical protein
VLARALQRPRGGVDRPVAEPSLHRTDIHAGFEQRRGDAVTERRDACAMLESGSLLGLRGDLLSRSDGQGRGGLSPRTEPRRWAIQLPVGPQFGQHACREDGGAILASWALLKTDQLAITLNVRQPQVGDLTDAPPGGVGGHAEGAGLGVLRVGAETLQFLNAQDAGQLRPPRARGQGEMEGIPTEGPGGEELQATGHLVTGTPRQVPFDEQMVEGRADLLRAQLVGGAPGERCESCDRRDRGVLGLGRQALQVPLVDHCGASRFHRVHSGSFARQDMAQRGVPVDAFTEPLYRTREDCQG